MPRAGRSIRWRIVAAACVLLACATLPAATPQARVDFACPALACGLPAHGAFPHFVVGRIGAIADEREAATLFKTMRAHGRWGTLPARGEGFWQHVQPVAIDAGGGAIFVVLTGQDEMRAAPLTVGDFVRYSPHRGRFEVPPAEPVAAAYWNIDGCVAVLCRASDRACVGRYRAGIYRTADGRELTPGAFAPQPQGAVIDTTTMVPLAPGDSH